jgi:putative membrane protein
LARAFGVPVSNLLVLAFVLACPLMVAGGQRGDGSDRPDELNQSAKDHDLRPAGGKHSRCAPPVQRQRSPEKRRRRDMMWWYGNGISGWGYALMTVSMVLFWALVIFGVIALFRYLGRSDRSTAIRPTPEQVLAERFARGDIDEQEYHQRLNTLRDRPRPFVEP